MKKLLLTLIFVSFTIGAIKAAHACNPFLEQCPPFHGKTVNSQGMLGKGW